MPKSSAARATGRWAVRRAWTKAVLSSDTVLVLHGMIDPLSAVDHARTRHPCPCTTCHPCPCAIHQERQLSPPITLTIHLWTLPINRPLPTNPWCLPINPEIVDRAVL